MATIDLFSDRRRKKKKQKWPIPIGAVGRKKKI